MKNKRGWIKILEAFIAIMLVASVFLILIQKGYIHLGDKSEEIYNAEVSVLRGIQINDSLRREVLEIDINNLPADVSTKTKSFIDERIPSYLECFGRVCAPDKICSLPPGTTDSENIYSQVVSINAETLDNPIYSPRKLQLFCWER